jgi:hypothetical protein
MLPFLGTATSLGTDSSSKPLDFRGSFWNHTTVGFSDWFIQQVLQSGFDQLASRRLFRRQPGSSAVTRPQQHWQHQPPVKSPLGGLRRVHQVIHTAGGDRLLLHRRRCIGIVRRQ